MTPFIATPIAVPHGFFTRQGGVSEGPFASLNCSISSADDRAAVLENRARAARALGANPALLLGLTQVLGADVATVHLTGHDTLAEPARFFSHRRRTLANEGPIGHQISVIAL